LFWDLLISRIGDVCIPCNPTRCPRHVQPATRTEAPLIWENQQSMDWFKGKFTGNPWVFTIKFVGFSGVNFPKNQSIETQMGSLDFTKQFMFSSLLQKLGERNLGQIWGFHPKRRDRAGME